MGTAGMTEKQRAAFEALQGAQRQGVTLSDYAKAQGLAIRELYDALAALRGKGLLPKSGRAPKSKFVEVRVAQERIAGAVVCRFRHAGVVLECAQWPPPSWVAALMGLAADAAS